MTGKAASKSQVLIAGLALALCFGLIVLGLLWHDVSADVHERIWRNIADRARGPMRFRFVLQPAIATLAAVQDGIADARKRRTPYLLSILTNSAKRRARLTEGMISIGRVVLLGLAMDVLYQHFFLHTFYPGEAVVIVILLAFLPYLLLRGLATRIARAAFARKSDDRAA